MKKRTPFRQARVGAVRADARRNVEAVLKAALTVFEKSGVDAPIREIAKKAGVGVGTLYRHFPQRSDLIVAIVRNEVDECAEAAAVLAEKKAPADALEAWMQRLVDLMATKKGLATALHSGVDSYQALPGYFLDRLMPAMQSLLDAAVAAKSIRRGVDAGELLLAGARLAAPAAEGDIAQARRMVSLLVDGLRFGAKA